MRMRLSIRACSQLLITARLDRTLTLAASDRVPTRCRDTSLRCRCFTCWRSLSEYPPRCWLEASAAFDLHGPAFKICFRLNRGIPRRLPICVNSTA